MKVRFACPSCDAAGTVDAVHIGKQVRCKHCGAHFAIPDPEMPSPTFMPWKSRSEQPASRGSATPARRSGLRAGTRETGWPQATGREDNQPASASSLQPRSAE